MTPYQTQPGPHPPHSDLGGLFVTSSAVASPVPGWPRPWALT
jgi:hypothetical protein